MSKRAVHSLGSGLESATSWAARNATQRRRRGLCDPSPCVLVWSTLRDGGRSIVVPLVPGGPVGVVHAARRRPDASGAVLPAPASVTVGIACRPRLGMAGSPPGGRRVAGLPSGAVTFLFSDIEGSARLVKALRDRCAQVLAEHRDLFRAAIAELTLVSSASATRGRTIRPVPRRSSAA